MFSGQNVKLFLREPLHSARRAPAIGVAEGSHSVLKKRIGLLLVLLLVSSGCITHTHTVGAGPREIEVRTHVTWYAFFGFLPINDLDTRGVVGGAEDYRLSTSFRPLDVIVNIFTSSLTLIRRTTTVEK